MNTARGERGRNIRAGRIAGAVAAVGLVVGAAYLISSNRQPPAERVVSGDGDARTGTGAATTTAPLAAAATLPLSQVAWASASYPVDCGGQTSASDPIYAKPQPDTQVAIVFVTCTGGNGTPPSAVLVYDGAKSPAEPHLRQTLVRYQDDWIPKKGKAKASGPDLAIDVYGYSDANVSRCCPDVETTLSWSWDGNQYVSTSSEPKHSKLPDPGS